MHFTIGPIDGVIIKDLTRHKDSRGWLVELFRNDEVSKTFQPVMSYISETLAGIARGPHEHRDQADLFCFLGPSTFRVFLWDARKSSKTYGYKMVLDAGEETPRSIIIPAGVVHAYKNIGSKPGWVVNLPNRLYAGEGRKTEVDEIRYEGDADTIYTLD